MSQFSPLTRAVDPFANQTEALPARGRNGSANGMEKLMGRKAAAVVPGLVLLASAPFCQGAEPCPGMAKDPVYLSCQIEGEGVSCAANRVLNRIKCQDMVPYFTPTPEYPPAQLSGEVEGWVLVGFTVTEQGGVANPIVINAQPPQVFDDAALDAVNAYRFHAPASPIKNVAIRISFSLQD